jgi:hypothetical protein
MTNGAEARSSGASARRASSEMPLPFCGDEYPPPALLPIMSAVAGPAHRARSRSMRPITRTTTPIVHDDGRSSGHPDPARTFPPASRPSLRAGPARTHAAFRSPPAWRPWAGWRAAPRATARSSPDLTQPATPRRGLRCRVPNPGGSLCRGLTRLRARDRGSGECRRHRPGCPLGAGNCVVGRAVAPLA